MKRFKPPIYIINYTCQIPPVHALMILDPNFFRLLVSTKFASCLLKYSDGFKFTIIFAHPVRYSIVASLFVTEPVD